VDEARFRRAYAFLDGYRDDEMAQLRVAAKKARTPEEKEELQRALASMESRKRAQAHRDRERELVGEHRERERELVSQGKKPFFLKRSEVKKQLLVDQFAGMKKGQVDRAIERKRKKIAGREKKDLPVGRRVHGPE
jgi:ribosomal RNA-processing protein 36